MGASGNKNNKPEYTRNFTKNNAHDNAEGLLLRVL